ncbi:MAG: RNA methyltransferase [Candidatus Eremiobacteraeota bacterium]|nr:RNA methyltransferase [Candidatus Eremiobacteraeota bacterium]
MADRLGAHSGRLADVRVLRSPKGRRAQGRFAFEGITLLNEARASRFPIEALYCTAAAYDAAPALRELDAEGVAVYILEERSAAAISDLRTPSGIVGVAPTRLHLVEELVREAPLLLVLADVNDPANAGTLLRSADAFGCGGVVFGRLGVDPYHPKVVRGSMGAVFRLPLAVGDPPALSAAAGAAGMRLIGLAAGAACLEGRQLGRPIALVVGNERHGLGRWEGVCGALLAIPMEGPSESLSAAVAGSIALYEASRTFAHQGSALRPCQESGDEPKSQDYRG